MTPHQGNTFLLHYSQQLLCLRLRLALCVASGTEENQAHCQVCRAMRGGPRTPSRTSDANLDSAFVESALVFVVPKIGGARALIGPPFTTPLFEYVLKKSKPALTPHHGLNSLVNELKMNGWRRTRGAAVLDLYRKVTAFSNIYFFFISIQL